MLAALAVATLVVSASGCAAEPDAGATPSASAVECPEPPVDPVGAEQAASCVYEGWTRGDEALAAAYGRSGILKDLPLAMADPELTLAGCAEGSGEKVDGLACIWKGTNSDGPVSVEMAMTGNETEGFRVSATVIVHN